MTYHFNLVNDRRSVQEVSVLIVGTGGLGVVGLTKLVADCLGDRFKSVHTEETRGIAQRRAPVRAVLRAGCVVRSARLPDGKVDILLAVEAAEALRAVAQVKPGTICVISDLLMPTSGALSNQSTQFSVNDVAREMRSHGAEVLIVPISHWLRSASLPDMLSSTAMFGAASRLIGSTLAATEERLARQFGKRMWEQNSKAVQIGFSAASHIEMNTETHVATTAVNDLLAA